MTDRYPRRIICMTEETTETLYLLGEQDRIVGISGFTVRPPQARREKPKVSAFTSAKIDRIMALEPDLALGFSDLQADIAAELVRRGVEVHIFNHRSVDGILNMVIQLGAMVGALDRATEWVGRIESKIVALKRSTQDIPQRPVVYFEEWNDPLITGIQWVTELVELAGGRDCFPEHSRQPLAKHRIVADPMEVVKRRPDIIIGSWCGKKFRPEQVMGREGWEEVPAVRHGHVYEIKSAEILQPGPAALTDGLDRMLAIIRAWQSTE